MALPGGFRSWLADAFGAFARFDEPMSRHTSLGVGGPAEAWVSAQDSGGLSALVSKCMEYGVPWVVTGRGTNLLVEDSGLSGVVITLGRGFTEIAAKNDENGAVNVRAGAGASLAALCRFAQKNALAGMNFAVGIPGSVGGAVAGNAGTAAGCVADKIAGIEIMRPDGSLLGIAAKDLEFSYRRLARPEKTWGRPGRAAIITGAVFTLKPGRADEIAAEAAELWARRKAGQPQGVKSAGCFFRNPPGDSAGRLIDKAGLKGARVGGAVVSAGHANFLVNAGEATAKDFFDLVEMVRGRVLNMFGVSLELEVTSPETGRCMEPVGSAE